MKKIYAIVNNKGGVGKTTTTLNVAAGLHDRGNRVLVIDLDAQSNSCTSLGWKPELEEQGCLTVFDAISKPKQPLPIYPSERGIYYCPASTKLSEIEVFLKAQLSPSSALKSCLERNAFDYTADGVENIYDFFDYIIMDCPPQMTSITINAMTAATDLVIPVQPNAFSIDGLAGVINSYLDIRETLNKQLNVAGILITMEDNRLRISKDCIDSIKEAFGDMVFNTRIRRGTDIEKAQSLNLDIFKYAPKSNVGEDYDNLINELINK